MPVTLLITPFALEGGGGEGTEQIDNPHRNQYTRVHTYGHKWLALCPFDTFFLVFFWESLGWGGSYRSYVEFGKNQEHMFWSLH
jgi:hypothetical protein